MYEKNLQLKNRPFTAALCIEHWCDVGNAGNVVQQTCGIVSRGMGISVIVGGSGTGKTLNLEMIARQCADRNPETVQIACSRLDQRRDILQRILFELNIPCRDLTDSDLRLTVIQHFRSVCGQHGRDVLLLVDEAHNLSIGLLDELRIIVESASRNQGRCQLVLAGTSRLEDHLNHVELDTFNQRIVCRGYLTAMNREETVSYVRQHLLRAGGGNREFFSPEALLEVANLTGGIPRLVNQLCDQCLVGLAASHGKTVSAESVNDAWCDIQNLPRTKVQANSPAVGALDSGNLEQAGSVEFGSLDDDFESSSELPATETESSSAPPASTAHAVAPGEKSKKQAKSEVEQAVATEQTTLAGKTNKQPMRAIVANLGPDPFGETFDSEERVQPPRGFSTEEKKLAPPPVPNSLSPKSVDDEFDPNTDDGLVATIYGSTEIASFSSSSDQDSMKLPEFQDPLEGPEVSIGETDLDENASKTQELETPESKMKATIPLKQPGRMPRITPTGRDDRDILLTAEETCFDPSPTGSEVDDEITQTGNSSEGIPLKGPHKSRAVRMDYHKLFAQLRDESA